MEPWKLEPCTLWQGYKQAHPFANQSGYYTKQQKKSLAYDPAIPLLGIYPKDFISYNKATSSSMFGVSLLTTARKLNQPRYTTCDIFALWSCLEPLKNI